MTIREQQFIDYMKKLQRPKEEIEFAVSKIKNPPTKLYRYRKLDNINRVCGEIEGNIFLQVNKYLNDPMDMYFALRKLDLENIFNDFVKSCFLDVEVLKQDGLSEIEIGKVLGSNNPFQELIKITQNPISLTYAEELFNLQVDEISKNFNGMYNSVRVACFTSTNTNTPMWYNYTNDYRGVCFEYDFSDLSKYIRNESKDCDALFPVIYTDNMPTINNLLIPEVHNWNDIVNSNFMNGSYLFQQMVYFKTKDWSYEREWRLCNKSTDGLGFELPKEEMFEDDEQKQVELAIDEYYEKHPIELFNNDMPEELLKEIAIICTKYNDKRMEKFLAKQKSGSPTTICSPSKIYLGHKISHHDSKKIVESADALKIPVYIMQVTNGGYEPLPYKDFLIARYTKTAKRHAECAKKKNDKREFRVALRICERADKLKSHKCDLLYQNQFISLYSLNKYEEAFSAIIKAIDINPKDPQYYNNAGAALRALERFPEAIDKYKKSIDIYPLAPKTHINLAVCYIHIGEYDKAINALKICKSQRIPPRYGSFNEELLSHKDFKATLEKFSDFKKQLKQHPDLYVWND
jgi:tetratricopeptide (TPR) repeat protein